MGRTLPTFTNIIEIEEQNWSKYRRALRKQDQQFFDEIFLAARRHLAENFYAIQTRPFDSILVSVIVDLTKRIHALEQRIEDLERKQT